MILWGMITVKIDPVSHELFSYWPNNSCVSDFYLQMLSYNECTVKLCLYKSSFVERGIVFFFFGAMWEAALPSAGSGLAGDLRAFSWTQRRRKVPHSHAAAHRPLEFPCLRAPGALLLKEVSHSPRQNSVCLNSKVNRGSIFCHILPLSHNMSACLAGALVRLRLFVYI